MRWIELDGAVNVRDTGGLATSDGGTTAGGRLLRGDNLQELSPADVTRLVRDIGLTTVVDLRSTAELAAEGPAPLDAVAGVRHVHLPVLPAGQPQAGSRASFSASLSWKLLRRSASSMSVTTRLSG